MTTTAPGYRFVDQIAVQSRRFADVLAGADPHRPVPTCPDWTAADLLWHLTEVQLYWATIVRDRLLDDEPAERAKPDRPTDPAAAQALFGQATAALVDALTTTPPDTPVATWSDDQTAGFVGRWQPHEALIHRVDAELTAQVGPAPIEAELAADGVTAALSYAYCWHPGWATLTPAGGPGRLVATDLGRSWTVQPLRWSGHSPDTGKDYDAQPMLQLVTEPLDPAAAAFTVSAPAADLDLWLWRRGDRVAVQGDLSPMQPSLDVGVP